MEPAIVCAAFVGAAVACCPSWQCPWAQTASLLADRFSSSVGAWSSTNETETDEMSSGLQATASTAPPNAIAIRTSNPKIARLKERKFPKDRKFNTARCLRDNRRLVMP
jgi:hypothetical protein